MMHEIPEEVKRCICDQHEQEAASEIIPGHFYDEEREEAKQ